MTVTIPASKVQRGHSIPGLGNAYIVEVDNDHYESGGAWHIVADVGLIYASFDTEDAARDELVSFYDTESYHIEYEGDDYQPGPYELTFTFHDANGEEGSLTVWSDNPVTVDQTEPQWVGGY